MAAVSSQVPNVLTAAPLGLWLWPRRCWSSGQSRADLQVRQALRSLAVLAAHSTWLGVVGVGGELEHAHARRRTARCARIHERTVATGARGRPGSGGPSPHGPGPGTSNGGEMATKGPCRATQHDSWWEQPTRRRRRGACQQPVHGRPPCLCGRAGRAGLAVRREHPRPWPDLDSHAAGAARTLARLITLGGVLRHWPARACPCRVPDMDVTWSSPDIDAGSARRRPVRTSRGPVVGEVRRRHQRRVWGDHGGRLRSLGNLTDPLPDPYLAVAELLILLMAPVMVVLMASVHACAPVHLRMFSLIAFGWMLVAACLTMTVHVVELVVARQVDPGRCRLRAAVRL